DLLRGFALVEKDAAMALEGDWQQTCLRQTMNGEGSDRVEQRRVRFIEGAGTRVVLQIDRADGAAFVIKRRGEHRFEAVADDAGLFGVGLMLRGVFEKDRLAVREQVAQQRAAE